MKSVDTDVSVQCPFCFEEIQVRIDHSGGAEQQFVYDCEVCCRPIELRVRIGADGNVDVEAARES